MNSLVANLPLAYILMCTCLWVDTFPSSIHPAVRFFVVVFFAKCSTFEKGKDKKRGCYTVNRFIQRNWTWCLCVLYECTLGDDIAELFHVVNDCMLLLYTWHE